MAPVESVEAISSDEIDTLTVLGEHLIHSILEEESIEVIKKIIHSDAPLWFQNDTEGISPLHAAVYTQNAEVVKLLIEQGAVWNAGKFRHPSRASLRRNLISDSE